MELYPNSGKINSKQGTKLFFREDAQGLLSLAERHLEQAENTHNPKKKQGLTALAETSLRQAQMILDGSRVES